MLIAHISDLHIRSDGALIWGRDTIQALAACVEHILALDPRPDVVLATGDLVDLGCAAEYRALRDGLARLTMPVYVIPGNHDDRAALRACFADLGYLANDGEFLHYTVEGFSLRLVALDTVIPGEVEGGLCADRLDWLDRTLAAEPDRPTLIFMHHPPFASGIWVLDDPPFAGGERMKAVIAGNRQVRQIIPQSDSPGQYERINGLGSRLCW
jgi:3',5'-cyclic AMP phosphodiesterase CpdA